MGNSEAGFFIGMWGSDSETGGVLKSAKWSWQPSAVVLFREGNIALVMTF